MDLARPGNGRLLAFALAAAVAFAMGLSVAQAGDEQRFPSDGVAPRATCDSHAIDARPLRKGASKLAGDPPRDRRS